MRPAQPKLSTQQQLQNQQIFKKLQDMRYIANCSDAVAVELLEQSELKAMCQPPVILLNRPTTDHLCTYPSAIYLMTETEDLENVVRKINIASAAHCLKVLEGLQTRFTKQKAPMSIINENGDPKFFTHVTQQLNAKSHQAHSHAAGARVCDLAVGAGAGAGAGAGVTAPAQTRSRRHPYNNAVRTITTLKLNFGHSLTFAATIAKFSALPDHYKNGDNYYLIRQSSKKGAWVIACYSGKAGGTYSVTQYRLSTPEAFEKALIKFSKTGGQFIPTTYNDDKGEHAMLPAAVVAVHLGATTPQAKRATALVHAGLHRASAHTSLPENDGNPPIPKTAMKR